jgi:carboxyl-terminal processing protease
MAFLGTTIAFLFDYLCYELTLSRYMPTLFRVIVATLCVVLNSSLSISQTPTDFRNQVITLKRMIELNHYSPRPVNDSFSEQLFDNIFRKLDPDTLYFGSSTKNSLQDYRLKLDDELNGNGWKFLELLRGAFKRDLLRADSLYAVKETSGRKKEITGERREIKKILQHPGGFDNYVASVYCDAISNSFDPHTEYMPLQEKQSFETALGTEGYYFGLSVRENDNGDLEIDRLAPGSPAWKCGDLNKGDVLVKLAWEGKEPIDLAGADPAELSELLGSANNLRMDLTVRKANGIEKTASLTKEKMKNEENSIQSVVLKEPGKIGYIYLPDFYTSMGGASGSCANDVAREIIKLKKENITALVLDVRFNGGGSLAEALDMAGIFINEGPLSMIREKTGKPATLKDMNRGTIYDGPMAILVNAQSASASELLAAVLQDYNRAVVIGSRTFGKGTAQIIMPVDTSSSPNKENPPYGFVKITTSKFYRIKGTTTQHAGVVPDITLPDLFDSINYHEDALPAALPSDTIAKNNYYKPLASLPLADLSAKSKARVANSIQFQKVKDGSFEYEEDIYIKEAAAVLNDLVNTQPTK